MSKLVAGVVGFLLAATTSVGVQAAALGPEAAACDGSGPAVLVQVEGLKQRTGRIRVQSYGGDPSRYFDKGAYLQRIELPVPAAGPIDICIPVPGNGTYAFSVRHDLDNSGKTGLSDGGGMSGNPRMSLFDVMFKRKPDPRKVQVAVHGVVRVSIVMNYVQGGSFGPVSMAAAH